MMYFNELPLQILSLIEFQARDLQHGSGDNARIEAIRITEDLMFFILVRENMINTYLSYLFV